MGNINLQEAFKALSVLNEEDFNLSSTEDIEELKDTLEEEDIDDTIDIIDVEAETEDEIKESYIGDVILDCSICHSKLYKKPDEVEIDEETELANITEECPYCFSTDGFSIIGEIAPYEDIESEEVEVEDEEEIEEGCSGKKRSKKLKEDLSEEKFIIGEKDGLIVLMDEDENIIHRFSDMKSMKKAGYCLDNESGYVYKCEELEEALPRDLMGQIRKNGARGYRGFNGGSTIYRDWKDNEYTGIQDYANASYEEISVEDVLSRKKNGEDLSNVYVMKDGVMIKLDSEGHPDIDKSTEVGMRANQSLRKTLTDADKIYSTDIKDLIDSDPEKAATRLADEDERDANYRLGHDRQKYSWDKRRNSDYVKNLQRRSTLKSQIDGIKASYDAGDISRKEMESKIASLKNRYAPSDWEAKNYQNARNRNADDRYYSSNKELQQPINDLRQYRNDLSSAKRRLSSAQRDLEQTNSGEGSSYTDYTYAKRQVEDIAKKIASLQRQLDYYQQKIDNGAQAKDVEKYTKEIERSQADIDAAQANIDKLLRRNKTESYKRNRKLKESADISEYQKWVDYDMEKLGRISKLTMNKIKKAGFSVVKDQYGDYEVIADRKDESLKEDNELYYNSVDEYGNELPDRWHLKPLYDAAVFSSKNQFNKLREIKKLTRYDIGKKDAIEYAKNTSIKFPDYIVAVLDSQDWDADPLVCYENGKSIDESLKEDFDMDSKVTIGIYGDEVREINARSVSDIVKYLKRKGFEVTDIDGDIDYGWEMNVTGYPKDLFAAICNVFPGYNQDSVSDFINAYSIDESLKEDFERVSIETDREKMEMSSDSNGKVTVTTEPKEYMSDEEVIAPVSDDVQKEINPSFDEEEIEDEDSVDVDFDEFSEEEFDELGESYLKKVYENVNSFKTSSVKMSPNSLIIEGIIGFNSGNSKKTSFIFEGKDITKRGKVRFIGENLQLTKGKKSFTLRGSMKGNKFIAESLNYNYKTKDNEGNSTRLYGTVKVKH